MTPFPVVPILKVPAIYERDTIPAGPPVIEAPILKRCSCGVEYTREQWAALDYVGAQVDDVEALELPDLLGVPVDDGDRGHVVTAVVVFAGGVQCGGCRADANAEHAPKNSAPYLAGVADTIVVGLEAQIETLCPFHREKLERFERIHRQVREQAGVKEVTDRTCVLCRRPAMWEEATFTGRGRPPRAVCNVCAPAYASSDLACTLRPIGYECPVCRDGAVGRCVCTATEAAKARS